MTETLVSFCVVCDAPEGACAHDGTRYLEPVVYAAAPEGGLSVPLRERERWDHPPTFTASKQPAETPVALADLAAQLEAVVYLDPALERAFRGFYEQAPLKASRLVASIVEGASTGRLGNPAGLLWKRLRELAASET